MNINDNKNSESQTKRILAYLRAGNRITPLEALRKFNCFRLGARIADIEKIIGYAPERKRHILQDWTTKAANWISITSTRAASATTFIVMESKRSGTRR